MTNSKSQLTFQSLPSDDPKQRRPDISLAQQVLSGWAPSVTLDQGLVRTIEHFDRLLRADAPS
ncbi:hypothetical protein IF690_15565 [Pseudomonas sp. SK3(2021)]|uniref:hypothetical protein n=1 Tax=Pseudomonas sp. SK3(2021) TaxID=2841064 RepID=UPI00192ABC7E|nr:hypothetical protein [Pseudomonas sp. SK3(2021)]QQZ39483.1 hypothetical protein IF690_15565 [Pseudomonas sp. SK3(2021)]